MAALLALLKKIPGTGWLGFAVFMAFASLLSYASFQRNMVSQLAFQKDSVEAAADTLEAFAHGHYTLFVKRVIQTQLERDSINKALHTIPKARVVARLSIDSVHDTVTVAAVVSDDSLMVMSFADTTHYPFHLSVNAIANTVRKTADFTYTVGVSPFRMNMRLDCGAETNGVRPASVAFDLPAGVQIALDSLQQSKEVCSPKPSLLDNGSGSTVKRTGLVFIVGGLLGAATYRFLKQRSK